MDTNERMMNEMLALELRRTGKRPRQPPALKQTLAAKRVRRAAPITYNSMLQSSPSSPTPTESSPSVPAPFLLPIWEHGSDATDDDDEDKTARAAGTRVVRLQRLPERNPIPIMLTVREYIQNGDACVLKHGIEARHSGYARLSYRAEELSDPVAVEQKTNTIKHYSSLKSSVNLWDHQRSCVTFMEDIENETGATAAADTLRGGLICDEMGLGKTLAILTRILEDLQAHYRATGQRFGRPTLIVCPKTLISTWTDQRERFMPREALSMHVVSEEHRSASNQDAGFMRDCCDVVLTTYPTIVGAYNKPTTSKYHILLELDWWRLVCDEAHQFVNQRTDKFEAMRAIRANRRWFVTGTPVQNELNDIIAALRFIGIDPTGMSPEDIQRVLSEIMISRLKKHVPIFMQQPTAQKNQREAVDVQIVEIDFDTEAERALYAFYRQEIKQKSNHQFRKIAVVINRLRQICVDPYVIRPLRLPRGMLLAPNDIAAQVSRSPAEEVSITQLPHRVARLYANSDGSADPLHVIDTKHVRWRPYTGHDTASPTYRAVHEAMMLGGGGGGGGIDTTCAEYKHLAQRMLPACSTKYRVILSYIQEQVIARGDRCIVFTSWVRVIRSFATLLDRHEIGYRTLTGNMNVTQRKNAIRGFQVNPSIPVIIISLKAGGFGINLAQANHVIFTEPWWNPYVADQAEARVRRYEQTKQVHVRYFIIRGTIEHHVLQVADRKRRLGKTILAASSHYQQQPQPTTTTTTRVEEEEQADISDVLDGLLLDLAVETGERAPET